ncbi:hypothetical protein [Dactylosporangium sp. NPDC051541]|uniref:hypothetical protein n=1 Tax=Dactylosporangium sp. NPDC051541 TaxID=3363977 RepID=UPI00379A1AAC
MTAHSAVPEGELDWPLAGVDTDGVTEIRVHGVGGSTPEAMLGERDARQVAGDRRAGFWRGADREIDGEPRWHREAYSWGGLTAKSWSSALWLILLPFALTNLAGWMALGNRQHRGESVRPAGVAGVDWRIAYQQGLVRVICLFTTWTYVLFSAQLFMDLGGWQCTQVVQCRLREAWSWAGVDMFRLYPIRAVAVMALLPALVVVLLDRLSEISRERYENFRDAGPAPRLDLPRATMAHAGLWQGGSYAFRARVLHLFSSYLLLDVLLLGVARHGGRYDRMAGIVLGCSLALLGYCVVAAGWDRARRPFSTAGPWYWVAAAIGVCAVVLAWLQPAGTSTAPGLMPGTLLAFDAVLVIVYATALLHAAVAIWARSSISTANWIKPTWWPGPYVAVVIATVLTYSVWAGFIVWTARWLSPSARPLKGPADRLGYPPVYLTIAQLTVVLATTVLVLTGIGALISLLLRRSRSLDWEEHAWPTGPADGFRSASAVPRWLRRVDRSKWIADVRLLIEWILGLTTIGATAAALWISWLHAARWLTPAGAGKLTAAIVALCIGLTAVAYATGKDSRPVEPGAQPGVGHEPEPRRRWYVGGAVALLSAATAFAAWIGWQLYPLPPRPLIPEPPGWLTWLPNEGVASTVLIALPVGSVLLVRQAIRSGNTRRMVGVAWDVATFWPRAFHPLAPPSYAERAVPEILIRVRHLLNTGQSVILAGHSQGAVLVTAVAAQLTALEPELRGRLSVITYGNPTAPLYMRWFPVYLNQNIIDQARAGTAEDGLRWVNFFRRTDPIGRELFRSCTGDTPPASTIDRAADCWLADPPTTLYRIGDGLPEIRGHAHAGYIRQPQLAQYLEAEAVRLGRGQQPTRR